MIPYEFMENFFVLSFPSFWAGLQSPVNLLLINALYTSIDVCPTGG